MTDHTTAAQADKQETVLTAGDIRAITETFGGGFLGPIQFARAVESTLLSKLRAPVADERAALADLLEYVDSNTCIHESTHRGGAIWTICDGCGAKWADDEGGLVPHQDAPAVASARAALASAPVAGEAVSSIRVFVKDGKVSHPASYGPRLADGFHTFYAAPQASESVVVQFAGVGSAGPFPVVDKHVTLPEATMQDLAQRLAPQASEAVPTEPLRVFSAGMWTYDGTGQAFSHTELDEAAFVTYRAALSAQPAAIRNPLIAEQSAQPGAQKEGSDAG